MECRSCSTTLMIFLLCGEPNSMECAEHLTTLLAICDYLNIPVATEKLDGPMTRLLFLCVEIGTAEIILHLPPHKLLELQDLVERWMGKKACYLHQLQSLAGKLQHACKVVRPGRTFLRQVFEMMHVTGKKYHHVRLNAGFRSDITWWHTFLASWNGVAIMPGMGVKGPAIEAFTNASGGMGVWRTVESPLDATEAVPAKVVFIGEVWGPSNNPKGSVASSVSMWYVG